MTRVVCAWLLWALFGLPAQAEDICKWVDAQGGVHYFDARQADRPCQAVIRVLHADPEELARSVERQKRLQSLYNPPAPVAAGPSADAERQAQLAQLAQQQEQRCRDATAELRFLEDAYGMRLVRPGGTGPGEAIEWVDDRERESLTQAWRAQVQAWCAATPPKTDVPAPGRVYGAPVPVR